MDTLWVILLVVAVVIVAGAFVLRRRGGTERGGTEIETAEAGAGPAAEAAVGDRGRREARAVPEREEPMEAPEAPAPESAARGERAEAPVEGREEAEGAAKGVEEGEPAEARPGPLELKERVEELLSDSERMLGELREVSDDEGERESVGIMAEGLTEVRTLAEEEKWAQAKDKGEALRAQLSMMLQSARRGESS